MYMSRFEHDYSPTKRGEGKHLDGSNPERVPGKQGEIPRPHHQGGKGGKASAFQGLPCGIDTFHFRERMEYHYHLEYFSKIENVDMSYLGYGISGFLQKRFPITHLGASIRNILIRIATTTFRTIKFIQV